LFLRVLSEFFEELSPRIVNAFDDFSEFVFSGKVVVDFELKKAILAVHERVFQSSELRFVVRFQQSVANQRKRVFILFIFCAHVLRENMRKKNDLTAKEKKLVTRKQKTVRHIRLVRARTHFFLQTVSPSTKT